MGITDVVVAGASAGGVEALRAMAAGLPADLPAPVVVVLHIARHAPSALPAILARSGPLPAVAVEQGTVLRNGTIYVAPADRHVLIADGHLHLSPGPAENGHRPAIDPLFRSAAVEYGARVIGVVLSGTGDDGTAGLAAVHARGGVALVQDPSEAPFPTMPASALRHVPGATAHAADRLGAVLAAVLQDEDRPPAGRGADPDTRLVAETAISAMSAAPGITPDLAGAVPAALSCPDCDGVLFELPGEPSPRFRCRVGHAWSPASLVARQADGVEDALWVALRALEERAALLRRLADHAKHGGNRHSADQHARRADETEADAAKVRALIVAGIAGPSGTSEAGTAS